MDIPVVSDAINAVKWLLDFFFNKVPKPITFIIFLLFIISFAAFINFSVQMMGIHCNSKLQVTKMSPLNVWDNFRIAGLGKDDFYNASEFTPSPIAPLWYFPVPASCFVAMCNVSGEYYYAYGSDCINKTTIYPYKVAGGSFFRCSDCQGTVDNPRIRTSIYFSNDEGYLCFGDVTRFNTSEFSIIKAIYFGLKCNGGDRCVPPVNYNYNYSRGTYICNNDAVCGVNITTNDSKYLIDEELKSARAELYYPLNLRKQDYQNVVKFKCTKDFDPELSFYNVPIFNVKVWLLGTLVVGLFIILVYYGQQSRL